MSEKAAKSTGHKMPGRLHVPRKEYIVAATALQTELNSLGHIRDMCFSSGHLATDVKVTQLCLTLCDPMDWSPPGSSVHGDSPSKNTGVGCHFLLQGIFPTRNWSQVSCIAGTFFTDWAMGEARQLETYSGVAMVWEKAMAPHSSTFA